MKQLFIFFMVLFMLSCSRQEAPVSKTTLQIGNHTIEIEIADTKEKQITGLMYRKSIPENFGMLFIYEKPDYLSFWMKNTHIPLSIAFIDADGILREIIDMEKYDGRPDYLLPHYISKYKVPYALEMRQGWFLSRNIQPGIKIEIPINRK